MLAKVSLLLARLDRTRLGLLLCALIIPIRSLDRVLTPQFLNEDGTILFVDAYNDGLWSLISPYSGYLITYQRIVAWFSSFFPFAIQPLMYTFGAMIALSVLVWFLTDLRCPFKPASLAVVLLVVSPFDGSVLLDLTNSQWLLGLLLLLLIGADHPRSVVGERLELALLGIISLSGPFSMLFSPLVLWRWLRERSRRARLLAIVILPCALLQTALVLLTYKERVTGKFTIENVTWLRSIAATLARFPSILSKQGPVEVSYPWLSIVCVFVLSALLWISSNKKRRYHVMYALTGGLLVGVAALIAYRGEPETLLFRPRYAFIPTMALFLGVIDLYTTEFVSKRVLSVFVGLILLSGVSEFFSKPLDDLKWRERISCIGGDKECVIELNWNNRHISYSPNGEGARGRGVLRNISYLYP